jgi:hypothetical protein
MLLTQFAKASRSRNGRCEFESRRELHGRGVSLAACAMLRLAILPVRAIVVIVLHIPMLA